jgi:hypothetical protein
VTQTQRRATAINEMRQAFDAGVRAGQQDASITRGALRSPDMFDDEFDQHMESRTWYWQERAKVNPIQERAEDVATFALPGLFGIVIWVVTWNAIASVSDGVSGFQDWAAVICLVGEVWFLYIFVRAFVRRMRREYKDVLPGR